MREALPGMLVTLKPMPWKSKQDRSPGIGHGYRCAYHGTETCQNGLSCVRFVSSRKIKYHSGAERRWKVSLKNVIAVLKHEEIHHVLTRLNLFSANLKFDSLHADFHDVCYILNCSNHQVTA